MNTTTYIPNCDECEAPDAGWPVEDMIVCTACFANYEELN